MFLIGVASQLDYLPMPSETWALANRLNVVRNVDSPSFAELIAKQSASTAWVADPRGGEKHLVLLMIT